MVQYNLYNIRSGLKIYFNQSPVEMEEKHVLILLELDIYFIHVPIATGTTNLGIIRVHYLLFVKCVQSVDCAGNLKSK